MNGATVRPREVGALEAALNRTLAAGRLLDAYATYYDEPAFRGAWPDGAPADPECSRVLRFFSWAERFHGLVPARSAAGAWISRSEWMRPAGPGGSRVCQARHVVTRRWRHGRVVHERIEEAPATTRRPSGTYRTED